MNGERSTADHAEGNKPRWRTVAGMIRRMVVTLATGGRWQLRGFRSLKEVLPNIEVFQGLGLWARAPGSATVEAIVLSVGDGDAPVVIALRDPKTRAAVAAALAEDTTLLYNSVAGVYITPAGLVELRSHGGTAAAIATFADLQALVAIIAAAPITPGDGGASLKTALAAWAPVGTLRARAE